MSGILDLEFLDQIIRSISDSQFNYICKGLFYCLRSLQISGTGLWV